MHLSLLLCSANTIVITKDLSNASLRLKVFVMLMHHVGLQEITLHEALCGVSFTITKSGDAPQLTSKWYIMFGKVEVVLKAAPGAGIVSSFVMQSDDLDEIDWEWLGSDPDEVQSNFFGKGQT